MQLHSTPKIAVGVTTTPNRQLNENTSKHLSPNTELFVFTDKDYQGVAYARNQLLKQMADYDYIFLMDDDCYPVMCGWEQYFIDQALQHNINYMVLPEAFKTELISVSGEMGFWTGGIGAFSFQTNKALATIGGYNSAYQCYGFEDAARLKRAIIAGLTGGDHVACPIRAIAYIHSEDVFGENPTANLSLTEKQHYITINQSIYQAEINDSKLYYAFDH